MRKAVSPSREDGMDCLADGMRPWEGMEASFHPLLSVSEETMVVNLSAEKREWIRSIAGDARTAYGRLMRSGVLVVSCDNRDDIEIIFPKAKFAHLCGFDYYWDAGKHRLAPQELFYDDIVSGDFPYARAIILTATVIGTSPCKKRRERTRAKVSIAAEVFNGLGTATHVVESAKSDIVIFMGQTMWSLGLGHQRMHDGEETSRHIPSSLINDSILSTHVHRGGTAVSAIIGLRWK